MAPVCPLLSLLDDLVCSLLNKGETNDLGKKGGLVGG